MNIEVKTKIINVLKAEADYVNTHEKDKKAKIIKLNEIMNLLKIIENFDELEPVLVKFFEEKAKKQKWSER